MVAIAIRGKRRGLALGVFCYSSVILPLCLFHASSMNVSQYMHTPFNVPQYLHTPYMNKISNEIKTTWTHPI
ncbi:hypothetical protein T492DRAFT_399632 [Pavlovales sp. CCMP2436]|nr:hypothetical protein T492DRAFT_399632 [Pavlovales sp. CCMP2436]